MKNIKQFAIGFLVLTFLYLLMNRTNTSSVFVVEPEKMTSQRSPMQTEVARARASQAAEIVSDESAQLESEPVISQDERSENKATSGLIQDLITELEWVPFENKAVDSHDHEGHEEGARKEVIAFAMKNAVLVKETKVRTLKSEELQLVQNFYEDCSLGRGTFQYSPAAIKVLCLTNLEEISFRYPEVRKTLENALQQSAEGTRQIYEFLRPHQSRGT